MNSQSNYKKVLITSILISVFFSIVLLNGGCISTGTNSKENIQHFSKSIDYSNKSTRISNTGNPHEQMEHEYMQEIVDYKKQAHEEAKQVDIDQLNRAYDGFGYHYNNEFIKGLDSYIEGFEESDDEKLRKGQELLDKWSDWYDVNVDKIRNL